MELQHISCLASLTLLHSDSPTEDPNELVILRHAFEKQFHKSMDKEVLDDLSLKTKDAFAIVLQGRWHDNGQVNQSLLGQDLQQLLPAFRHGFTDEMLM